MYLDEFFDYKNQFMQDILTNTEIVKLLHDDYKEVDHPEEYMYTQVFPYAHLPDTVEHGFTFICCDVDISRTYNKTYYQLELDVYIFTHKSKMRLPEGGVRVDRISAEIARLLDGSRMYGLGELNMSSSKRFAPMADYQGRILTFTCDDFNRTTPTGKPVPPNRKKVT